MGRFYRALPLVIGLFLVGCGAAEADEYVGGDRLSAVFLAWTVDGSGHLQGQVQMVTLNGAETKSINASFYGTRQGSEISLAFPLLGAFGGSTWTGHVGWRTVTLDLPSSNGTPTEVTLTAGSFGDFQRRVSAIRNSAGQIGMSESLARDMFNAQKQVQDEYQALTSAIAWMRGAFPLPLPSPDNPNTFHAKYAQAWTKMQDDWEKEKQAADFSPMSCYQKSQVTYIASNVNYDRSQFTYLDSTFNPFENEAQRDIEIVLAGPNTMRLLAANYNAKASAWRSFTHVNTQPLNVKAYVQAADQMASRTKAVAVPRLASARQMIRDFDRRADVLNAQAAKFPETVECSN